MLQIRTLSSPALNAVAIINFLITGICYCCIGFSFVGQVIPRSLLVYGITCAAGWLMELFFEGDTPSNTDIYEVPFVIISLVECLIIMVLRAVIGTWVGLLYGTVGLLVLAVLVCVCVIVSSDIWAKSAKNIRQYVRNWPKIRKLQRENKQQLKQKQLEEQAILKARDEQLNHKRLIDY